MSTPTTPSSELEEPEKQAQPEKAPLARDRSCGDLAPCHGLRPAGWPLVLAVVLALAGTRRASAELLLHEAFDYPAGNELGEVSSQSVWENDKDEIRIAGGSLDHPNLAAAVGNSLVFTPTNPNPDGVRTIDGAWAEQFSGTLYVSFILQLETISGIRDDGEGTALLSIGHSSNSSQLFSIHLRRDEQVRLGVVKHPSDGSLVSSAVFFDDGPGADLAADGTTRYLVVAKYEWVEGEANDKVTLWVNPTTPGSAEDPENQVITAAGADGDKSAARLTLCRGPHLQIDELRIGQSWAEVTPPRESSKPWWPLAVLIGVLAVAALWITYLRRTVHASSAALGVQIEQRQKAEQQRLVEQERARIAHDLHDELGADITEISMLATRARHEDGRECMEQVVDKARQMVGKLEEIVWAMNPEHDSLGALVDYFSFFADRFLGLANIRLVVDSSADAADLAVDARMRHQLFLVFREALANVVRHSGAGEVRVAVAVDGERRLRVVVADDGSGLRTASGPDGKAGHEGIASMRRRIEALGGEFDIAGGERGGTRVSFSVPLES